MSKDASPKLKMTKACCEVKEDTEYKKSYNVVGAVNGTCRGGFLGRYSAGHLIFSVSWEILQNGGVTYSAETATEPLTKVKYVSSSKYCFSYSRDNCGCKCSTSEDPKNGSECGASDS